MFDGECLCDGPVEQWLNSVVDAMKQALFAEYVKAIPAYDNMKRSTEWIYEFSAQNTIVVSRTFFTQEVNEAFEELEEGNEDALKVLFPSIFSVQEKFFLEPCDTYSHDVQVGPA